MGKRTRLDEPSHDAKRSSKKPRHDATANHAPTEDIINARQLQSLLVFQQDEALLRKSINSFKAFLASILHPENEDDVPRRRAILREYLDSQQPRNVQDEETVYLPELMQSLNYAATANNDNLLSATTSAIDQLLKLLSTSLELREYGLLLCKTLLQQAQLRTISRGVASAKHKEHVIGPCLRILKEIVTFDGGTLARQVYAKRDLAFDPQTISRCLTYRRADAEGIEDIVKRPSVRTTAIRYILAHFKFQEDGAKADMLRQGNVLHNIVNGIENDHPRIIREILSSFTRDVIQDTGIPRRNKSFLFNERNLVCLCQLYRTPIHEENPEDSGRRPLMEVIHEFMVTACTTNDAGIKYSSGWYPPTTDSDGPSLQPSTDSTIDLGLDGIEWYAKFAKQIPIRNQTLSDFILTLRPYAYDMERQLLIAIFEAAPELVAWYYRKMVASFPFAPKLTATWVGYAATLFETVSLPVPVLFTRMAHLPPPASIVIESILPGPLDQKTLRQCLVSKSDLIRFFALRILVASFQKLRDVLAVLREKASTNGKLWSEAADKLVEEFCRRAPTLQDVTKVYGTLKNADDANDKAMQREATLRLLALYHEVLPQIALEENFDVSVPLANALQETENATDDDERSREQRLALLELSHLVKIASWSSSVHWFAKAKGLQYSPLVSLLRLLARSKEGQAKDIEDLIKAILRDSDAITTERSPKYGELSGLESLMYSLRLPDVNGTLATDAVYAFIDKCFHRYSTRPIKYEDDKDAILAERFAKREKHGQEIRDEPCSLVQFTMLEQYDFVQENKDEVGRWLTCFFFLLQERISPILHAEKSMQDAWRQIYDNEDEPRNAVLIKALQDSLAVISKALNDFEKAEAEAQQSTTMTDGNAPHKEEPKLDSALFAPPPQPDTHPVLTRYRKKDLESLIEDGSLSSLISCLGSPDFSIRIQAMEALRSTMVLLQGSNHQDKEMFYLLLGALLETCTLEAINDKPLTGLAVTFAAKAVDVLKDPTHALYIKVNEFLNRGPSWRVRSMPAWWLEKVLLHPPGDADSEGAFWREVVWMLEWLYDGLLANSDFDILRRNGAWEKVMALFFHPGLDITRRFADLVTDGGVLAKEAGLQAKVGPLVLRLVARAALVEGATILVTGTGAIAWLSQVKDVVYADEKAVEVVLGVRGLVLDHADKEKISEWSSGALP